MIAIVVAVIALQLTPTWLEAGPRTPADPTGSDSVPVTREAYLMGTRVTLAARDAPPDQERAVLDELLASLERSENDLSTWRDTPFNRLNTLPEGVATTIDPARCDLIRELDAWTTRTAGAFDPAVGPLLDLWGVPSRARVPSAAEIRGTLAVSHLRAWRFDAGACTLVRPAGGRLDAGAFGKGEAIDRARRVAVPATSWMIDLGGQIGVNVPAGARGWPVGIAHPHARDRALFEIELREGSLATSGGSERDQRAERTRVGHILDPRTGSPARFAGSVVVWHQRGLIADILSTALYVMGAEAGLEWAERNGFAACFLIPAERRVDVRHTSSFGRLFGVQASQRRWEPPV